MDADVESQPVLAEAQRLEELLQQYFAGVDRRQSVLGHRHTSSSVVVADLHVVGVAVAPCKADAPLIVDAHADWPARSPESFSSRLAGGLRRSLTSTALLTMRNLRKATVWMSLG